MERRVTRLRAAWALAVEHTVETDGCAESSDDASCREPDDREPSLGDAGALLPSDWEYRARAA
jgi:hypothetical protein